MTTQILWRDACAMSKSLRKHLGARAQATPLSAEESLDLVRLIQPDRFQNHEPETPTRANHRSASTTPTLVTRPPKGPPLPGGLLLGHVPKKRWLSKPQELWLTEEGLLRQTVLYGCTGAGRTETLLTLALNAADPRMRHGHSPAPKPRSVFYMDGKGDPSVYAKTLAGLSERQSAGNLRVINLMTGPEVKEQREQGRKVSHSLDLFEGFDESMLGRWLVDMAPEALLTEPGDARLVREMMPTVARLAVAFAHQEKQRITPKVLTGLMNRVGAEDHAQNLEGEYGHLARQWVHQNWGAHAKPRRASLLKEYDELLTAPFSFLDHVFESFHPEVSLARLHEPKDTQSYVLVLAPAMEKAPESVAMLTRAIATSFRLGLEKRAPTEHCDTLAVFDEFEYCLEPADIKAMVCLQNRGCGVVWASDGPNDVQKAWRRDEVDLFEWAGVETGTHVMMHQCYSHRHGGGHLDVPYVRHQQRHWPAGSFPDQPIEEVFQALREGEAFVWNGSSLWRTNMDYANVPTLRSYFLTHAQHLPPTDYAFSSTRLVTVNEERQTQVLQQRFSEWSEKGETPAPALSWCQETVARMLGFSNWHEANEVLGKR
jgi:hypothetical protein